jgi:hypothetical protein
VPAVAALAADGAGEGAESGANVVGIIGGKVNIESMGMSCRRCNIALGTGRHSFAHSPVLADRVAAEKEAHTSGLIVAAAVAPRWVRTSVPEVETVRCLWLVCYCCYCWS